MLGLNIAEKINEARKKWFQKTVNAPDESSLQFRIERGFMAENFSVQPIWIQHLRPYFENRPKQYANALLDPGVRKNVDEAGAIALFQSGRWAEVNDLYATLQNWIDDGRRAKSILDKLQKIQEDKKS